MDKFNYMREMEECYDEFKADEFLSKFTQEQLIECIETGVEELGARDALLDSITYIGYRILAIKTEDEDLANDLFQPEEARLLDSEWKAYGETAEHWKKYMDAGKIRFLFPPEFGNKKVFEFMLYMLKNNYADNWGDLKLQTEESIKEWETKNPNWGMEEYHEEKLRIEDFDAMRNTLDSHLEQEESYLAQRMKEIELQNINNRLAYIEVRKEYSRIGYEILELIKQCNLACIDYVEELCKNKPSFFSFFKDNTVVEEKLEVYNNLVDDTFAMINESWNPALEKIKAYDDYKDDQLVKLGYSKMEQTIAGFGDMIEKLDAEIKIVEEARDEISKEKFKTAALMTVAGIAAVTNVAGAVRPSGSGKYVDDSGKEYDAHQIDSYGHVKEEYR